MATLSGTTPAATYPSLIKFNDNNAISASLRLLSDGAGGATPLYLSASQINIGNGAGSINATLGLKGGGSTSATSSLIVQNSNGNEALRIYDDRLVVIGSIIQSDSIAIGQSNPNLKGIGQSGSRIIVNYVNAGGVKFQNTSTGFPTLIVGEVSENMISLGGITSSFPALKRASNNLELKNADDTFGAGLSLGAALVASAILQADSTSKGLLPPRMTTIQKNAIATPAAGLIVYDTTLNKLCVYTTAWETITSI